MKKLFAVIAITGAFVACNNSSEGTGEVDTTIQSTDTTTFVQPSPDTMQVVTDTTIKVDVNTDTTNISK